MNYKLIHKQNILDGDNCCELVVEETTKEEEIAFSENEDWTFVDK